MEMMQFTCNRLRKCTNRKHINLNSLYHSFVFVWIRSKKIESDGNWNSHATNISNVNIWNVHHLYWEIDSTAELNNIFKFIFIVLDNPKCTYFDAHSTECNGSGYVFEVQIVIDSYLIHEFAWRAKFQSILLY